MTEQVDILLSRYFSGEATEQELRRLDDWLAESAEHEAYFDELTRLYEQSAMLPPVSDFDVSTALGDFKKHMEAEAPAPKMPSIPLRYLRRMVAVASVVLVLGFSAFYFLSREMPAGEEVQWVADDRNMQVELFEEATVVLEPHSSVACVENKKNELTLTGKATFTVAPRQETKLLVRAGDTFVEDIGTVFTVTAPQAGGPVVVEVAEGEVLFYTATNEGISVRQHETGLYDPATGQFSFREEAPDEIQFMDTPLGEVVAVLSARYGADIEIRTPSLADVPIHATFDADESLEVVLDILAETLMLDISKEGNTYVVTDTEFAD